MKAWRNQAHGLKLQAIAAGTHEKGARYGKMIRDLARGAVKQTGLISPLMARILQRGLKERTILPQRGTPYTVWVPV